MQLQKFSDKYRVLKISPVHQNPLNSFRSADGDVNRVMEKVEKIESKIIEAVQMIDRYYKKLEKLMGNIKTQSQSNLLTMLHTDQILLDESQQNKMTAQNYENFENFLSKASDEFSNYEKSNEFKSQNIKNIILTKLKFLNQKMNDINDRTNLIEGIQLNLSLQSKVSKQLYQEHCISDVKIQQINQNINRILKKLEVIEQKQLGWHHKINWIADYLTKCGFKYAIKIKNI